MFGSVKELFEGAEISPFQLGQRMNLDSWICDTQLHYFKSFIKFKIIFLEKKEAIW